MELFPVSMLQHITRGFDENEVPVEALPEVADTKSAGDGIRLPPIVPHRDSCASSSTCSGDKGEEDGKGELSDASSLDDDGLKRPNDLYERYLFRIRTQRDGESHCKFLQVLKDQADNCDFGEYSSVMVRDQVIFGTNNADLRELMLGQRNLTMAKVEELCRAADEGTLAGHVLSDNKENDPNFRKRHVRKRHALTEINRDHGAVCAMCNVVHGSESCPTQERMCYMCRRTGCFGPECTAGPVAIEDVLKDSGEGDHCELFGWFHTDFFKGFGVFDEL